MQLFIHDSQALLLIITRITAVRGLCLLRRSERKRLRRTRLGNGIPSAESYCGRKCAVFRKFTRNSEHFQRHSPAALPRPTNGTAASAVRLRPRRRRQRKPHGILRRNRIFLRILYQILAAFATLFSFLRDFFWRGFLVGVFHAAQLPCRRFSCSAAFASALFMQRSFLVGVFHVPTSVL